MSQADRLTHHCGALIVVDMQEKLADRIVHRDQVLANCVMLVKVAQLLGMPVLATEQYPKGLGTTLSPLAELIPHRPEKTSFQCCANPEILEQLYGRKIRHVTLAGIEAHVCVAQTALELLKLGFPVQVLADAVGSRHEIDRDVALRRLERAGAVVSTTVAAIFEWTETADHPKFKEISAFIKASDRFKVGDA